ncbi:hypothetical protein [Corynebacterium cystitidis]|uniref:Endonuclease G n=1 Tax=Corynebacterium cystitidis DSM 20524 TaxID=1121357 RepID=A0A1H9RS26_9CORY|nr:hypothetical protein [Corynebacterium cystitidis]WJY82060.1 hypothetical protein CCYS_05620 [Corynebacterium cystitidis DSM 20524]SER75640.1 endonuclease G [Corynebacterium cystitidis DSM 20524]SNV80032.1 Uncharacterised protein [Corynebacterium cystitidis]
MIYYCVGGQLRAQAFILSQNLANLEVLDLREFDTYQFTLAAIGEQTGVTFTAAPTASSADSGTVSGLGPDPKLESERVRVLLSVDDIIW